MPKKKNVNKSKGSKTPKSTPAMTPNTAIVVNPLQPPVVDIEHIPLADIDYKIVDPIVEFNLLDIHNWCFEKYLYDHEKNSYLGIQSAQICSPYESFLSRNYQIMSLVLYS